jgi:excisionase family DNA binding protein
MTRRERELVNEGLESVADAAAYLAISKSRVYELLHSGSISYSKHGNKFVVSRAALRRYALVRLKVGSIA